MTSTDNIVLIKSSAQLIIVCIFPGTTLVHEGHFFTHPGTDNFQSLPYLLQDAQKKSSNYPVKHWGFLRDIRET